MGGILALVTIILAAANAVSAQQAIALALPATIITIAGLIRTVIPDSWSAWRRGFQQGCEVALMYPRDPPYPGGAVAPSGPKPLGPHPFPPAAR